MSKIKQFVFAAALLAFIAIGAPCVAGTAGFNQFIGFGDSTLDTGYFRYHTAGNAFAIYRPVIRGHKESLTTSLPP